MYTLMERKVQGEASHISPPHQISSPQPFHALDKAKTKMEVKEKIPWSLWSMGTEEERSDTSEPLQVHPKYPLLAQTLFRPNTALP